VSNVEFVIFYHSQSQVNAVPAAAAAYIVNGYIVFGIFTNHLVLEIWEV
jgi:hypothetical protein